MPLECPSRSDASSITATADPILVELTCSWNVPGVGRPNVLRGTRSRGMSVASKLVATTAGYGAYVVLVLQRLAMTPLLEIDYQPILLSTVVVVGSTSVASASR